MTQFPYLRYTNRDRPHPFYSVAGLFQTLLFHLCDPAGPTGPTGLTGRSEGALAAGGIAPHDRRYVLVKSEVKFNTAQSTGRYAYLVLLPVAVSQKMLLETRRFFLGKTTTTTNKPITLF